MLFLKRPFNGLLDGLTGRLGVGCDGGAECGQRFTAHGFLDGGLLDYGRSGLRLGLGLYLGLENGLGFRLGFRLGFGIGGRSGRGGLCSGLGDEFGFGESFGLELGGGLQRLGLVAQANVIVQEYGLELGKGLVQGLGKALVGGERHLLVGLDIHGVAGGDVDALAGLHGGHLEGADALDLDTLAVDERLGNGGEQLTQEEFAHAYLGRGRFGHEAGQFN